MRIPLSLNGALAALLSTSLLLTGCQTTLQCPEGRTPGKGESDSASAMARIPAGAATRRQAAEKFFAAYKAHNRSAAQVVAADAAINRLNWNPQSGDNPTLQLIDDTHIRYEGGSIEMKMTRNADGRWYVSSVVLRAD